MEDLFSFLDSSPTSWHCAATIAERLSFCGFTCLKEVDDWPISPGKAYFVMRDGSVIAWWQPQSGANWTLIGAHTDSPNLRLKPNPVIERNGLVQFTTEVYGGALLNPWFDRDLSLAGRVFIEGKGIQLVDFNRAIAIIPSLAIHLDRNANKEKTVNAEEQMVCVVSCTKRDEKVEIKTLVASELGCDANKIHAPELCLYPIQKSSFVGLNNEFISGSFLDNQLSCWMALKAITTAQNPDGERGMMIVLSDHEEIGSRSSCGADSPFLNTVFSRINLSQDFQRVISESLFLSVDNAHAVHPNFPSKHAVGVTPQMNDGPVLKINASKRYATGGRGQAIIERLAKDLDISLQYFASRSDLACGSTIGPITASWLGIETVDLGLPTLAMHSCRELAGSEDPEKMIRLLTSALEGKCRYEY